MGVAHYCYVLGITIPFDVRDLKYDLPSQKTIPQIIGVNASRMLSLFLILVFSLMMLYIDQRLWSNGLFYLSVLTQFALIIFMNEKRSDVYYAGLIDGAIALLGFSYFLVA